MSRACEGCCPWPRFPHRAAPLPAAAVPAPAALPTRRRGSGAGQAAGAGRRCSAGWCRRATLGGPVRRPAAGGAPATARSRSAGCGQRAADGAAANAVAARAWAGSGGGDGDGRAAAALCAVCAGVSGRLGRPRWRRRISRMAGPFQCRRRIGRWRRRRRCTAVRRSSRPGAGSAAGCRLHRWARRRHRGRRTAPAASGDAGGPGGGRGAIGAGAGRCVSGRRAGRTLDVGPAGARSRSSAGGGHGIRSAAGSGLARLVAWHVSGGELSDGRGRVAAGAGICSRISNCRSGCAGAGRQRLAVHGLPGGVRVIDALGRDDADIVWSGVFSGSDAAARARALDLMRAEGGFWPLTWDWFFYTVVIARFDADYTRSNWIPYRITCTVLRDETAAAVETAVSLATQRAGRSDHRAGARQRGGARRGDRLARGHAGDAAWQQRLCGRQRGAGGSVAADRRRHCRDREPAWHRVGIGCGAGWRRPTGLAGQLAALTAARGYVGRAGANLANADT